MKHVASLDSEDGGDMFLQWATRRCTPEDRTLRNHHSENLKSCVFCFYVVDKFWMLQFKLMIEFI
jgi:hypothetical protein